ncbi:unnamed protein product [Camellia sinensis]
MGIFLRRKNGRCGLMRFIGQSLVPLSLNQTPYVLFKFDDLFLNNRVTCRVIYLSSDQLAEMVNLRDEATQSGMSMTQEDLSRQVFGENKRYLHGIGIGPRPSSFISKAMSRACACDHEMETLRSEIKTLREEWQRDHDELMKEREEGKKLREATQAQINHLHTMVTHLLQGRGGRPSVCWNTKVDMQFNLKMAY